MFIKSWIIAAVVRLQFPPFTWLFRFMYWAAVQVSTLYLRTVSGVIAIYPSGSLSRGGLICGLSDIDFKIFVAGTRKKDIYEEIINRLNRLKRFFPMVAAPDEQGVCFIEDFMTDYANYPLIQHRFDRTFYRHRLLWGCDVIAELPLKALREHEARLSCIWLLKYWAERIGTYCDSPYLSAVQRRYLFYKAVCDSGLVYLMLMNHSWSGSEREEVLQELAEHGMPEENALITQLISERRRYFRKEIAPLAEVYLLFRRIVASCFARLESPEGGHGEGWLSLSSKYAGSFTGSGGREIDRLTALCPPGAMVIAYPWVHVPLSPLDCEYFGCPLYIVSSERAIDLDTFIRLKTLYQREMMDRAIVMIRDNDHCLYSVCSDLIDHWLAAGTMDDLVFPSIQDRRRKAIDPLLQQRVKDRLAAYLSQVEGLIRSRDLYRVDRRRYMKFLFTMVQTLVLYRAMQEGQFLFLKDATDVASFLKNATPLSHDFVDRLYGEYIMVASRQRPFAEAFFEKTRTFLTMFVEVIRNGAPWGELASLNQLENAQKLSVSVIIITRSRCEQLRRCLASLLHLERLPDELIVIDNGSRDATSDVVASFQAPFPVRYFYESTVGVGAARNAGVRAAACDVLAFIDDDAVAEPQWLSAIENAFLRDPRIGIVGGSIKNLRDARDDLLYRYLDLVERM